ncbi:TPA: helix-turn-helix transcriptional regulator [Acinetobacter baumannii]
MNTPLHECEKFLRTVDLVGNSKQRGILGVSKSTLWRWIQQNRFPKPVRIGSHIALFKMSEIQAWMKAQR